MLCTFVCEERGNGEGAGLQELGRGGCCLPELCRLSYTRRYIRFAVDSARGWGLLDLCACVSE
jgi:hypothetical protein